MNLSRMTSILVVVFLSVVPISAQKDVKKPASAEASSETQLVATELGYSQVADLPKTLAKEFQPDGVSLEEIRKDPKKHAFRAGILEAIETSKKARQFSTSAQIHMAEISDQGKRNLMTIQEGAARLILQLEENLDFLELIEDDRKKETSQRWQAHYDYLVAVLQVHLAMIHEYDLALGRVRAEDLPELKKSEGQTGWKLVPSDKMLSKKEIKDIATSAQKDLEAVIKKYPDTPWATLATVELDRKIGLQWEGAEVPMPKLPKPKK